MKANRKIILDNKAETGYPQMAMMIVGLLLAIVIGVLIYFEVSDIDEFNEKSEYFTGYTAGLSQKVVAGDYGENSSSTTVNLTNSPKSATYVNVTCYNASAELATDSGLSYPSFTVNHKSVFFAADAADVFTQVNVTYTSRAGTAEAADITPMAQTVFTLLPIIALVVIAGIILALVLGFGGKRKI